MFDGTHFIPEAIATGAQCVLSDIYNPFYSKTTQIITKDIKKTSVQIADRFYQSPHKDLFMVGVTGTNGKTTTSYLIKHILDSVDKHAGVIGVGGLMLCRIPEETVEERTEYFREQTRNQMKAVDDNLMRESHPQMPIFNDRQSRVSFGGKD